MKLLATLLLVCSLSMRAQTTPATTLINTSQPSFTLTVTAASVVRFTDGTYGNQTFLFTICYPGGQYPVTYSNMSLRGTFDAGTWPAADDCQDFSMAWVVSPARAYWLITPRT